MQIVLASQSPRRLTLLQQIAVQAEVQAASIDETPLRQEQPLPYVERMALEKARAVAKDWPQGTLVLGADTAIALDDQIIGKPQDREDALRILGLLSGRSHRVITAVALLSGSEQVVSVATDVSFREISRSEMQTYWNSGEPHDKAGAYAIQGLGAVFVARIEGSYSAVMGLPLFETAALLAANGAAVLSPQVLTDTSYVDRSTD